MSSTQTPRSGACCTCRLQRRLFSEVQKNWAAQPLDSYETILNYACTTRTTTGLQVKTYLIPQDYPTGVRISDQAMDELQLRPHDIQPSRNYTLTPRQPI